MQKQHRIDKLPDVEFGPAVDAKVREMIAIADRDLEEIRVNFRWRRHQLGIVKRAAELVGVPYQTYIKHVLFKQGLADIREAQQDIAKTHPA